MNLLIIKIIMSPLSFLVVPTVLNLTIQCCSNNNQQMTQQDTTTITFMKYIKTYCEDICQFHIHHLSNFASLPGFSVSCNDVRRGLVFDNTFNSQEVRTIQSISTKISRNKKIKVDNFHVSPAKPFAYNRNFRDNNNTLAETFFVR